MGALLSIPLLALPSAGGLITASRHINPFAKSSTNVRSSLPPHAAELVSCSQQLLLEPSTETRTATCSAVCSACSKCGGNSILTRIAYGTTNPARAVNTRANNAIF